MSTAPRRAYIDNVYGQLHYRVAQPDGPATRPPLLCLHQSPKSGWDYEPIMPELARDRVVLAPDTPGYGGSDPPPAPVDIHDYATALLRFMDDVQPNGGAPFDVIGYHTGSLTATHMALTWPARVRRVILIGLAAYDTAERERRLANIGRFPTPRPDASHVIDLWRLMESMHDTRIDLAWKHDSLAEHLRPGARLPWGFMAVYRYDFRGALARLTQPVLVIAPEDDLWAVTREAAGLIPHAEILELRGASHGFLKLDAPDVCVRLRRFLDAT